MIARCDRIVNDRARTNEADLSLDIFVLPILLLLFYLALLRFGISGRATTRGASTAKTRWWWYWGSWLIC